MTELSRDCARPSPTLTEKPDPEKYAQLWLVSRLSPKRQDLAETGGVNQPELIFFFKCLIETPKVNETGHAI